MSWAGEDPGSGIMIFTEDGSYDSVVGTLNQVLIWGSGGAQFVPQSQLAVSGTPGPPGPSASGALQVSVSGAPVNSETEEINFTGFVDVQSTSSGVNVEILKESIPGISGSIVVTDGAGNMFASQANVDSSGTILLPGGQIVNGVLVSSASYFMQQTDWLVISTATIARTIYLPSAPDTWQYHNIKDGAGNSKNKNLTIDGNGKTIDGNASAVINGKYTCLSFVYNGTEWNII